jgi:hypothetical protein
VTTLAFVILGLVVLNEGMELGCLVAGYDLPRRPLAFRIVGFVITVAAVGLALKVVL